MSESQSVATKFWKKGKQKGVVCTLCPRYCNMNEGQRGLCYVRGVEHGKVRLFTYGRSSGFCLDPIEKKPLNHFLPGTPVLSFGTAGCNLSCKFCQNHEISKAREMDAMQARAEPVQIAEAALRENAASVAYTYNDPVIFFEYAVDVAKACRARGVRNVAVTAGYICAAPRVEFFENMDAANIDLKSFRDDFYFQQTAAHLAPVLETLKYVHHETDCWLEITTLLIPEANDSVAEIRDLAEWIAKNLSTDVPLHFTGFHPDYRMQDRAATPIETLLRAREIAKQVGLNHVYIGNRFDRNAQSSYCSLCGMMVIGRNHYALDLWGLDDDGHCMNCGMKFPGVIEGGPGRWGRKRARVQI